MDKEASVHEILKVVSLLLRMFTNLFDVVVEVTAVPLAWEILWPCFGNALRYCLELSILKNI